MGGLSRHDALLAGGLFLFGLGNGDFQLIAKEEMPCVVAPVGDHHLHAQLLVEVEKQRPLKVDRDIFQITGHRHNRPDAHILQIFGVELLEVFGGDLNLVVQDRKIRINGDKRQFGIVERLHPLERRPGLVLQYGEMPITREPQHAIGQGQDFDLLNFDFSKSRGLNLHDHH